VLKPLHSLFFYSFAMLTPFNGSCFVRIKTRSVENVCSFFCLVVSISLSDVAAAAVA